MFSRWVKPGIGTVFVADAVICSVTCGFTWISELLTGTGLTWIDELLTGTGLITETGLLELA